MSSETLYHFVKGQGWVPATRTHRSAQETQNMCWKDLKTGDAVFVIDAGKRRIARVHKEDKYLTLEPDDTGSWLYPTPNETAPFRTHCFSAIKNYGRRDRAWEELVGVSFPGGKDYE